MISFLGSFLTVEFDHRDDDLQLFQIFTGYHPEYHGLSWHFNRQVFVGEKENVFVQHKLVHKVEYCSQ